MGPAPMKERGPIWLRQKCQPILSQEVFDGFPRECVSSLVMIGTKVFTENPETAGIFHGGQDKEEETNQRDIGISVFDPGPYVAIVRGVN